MIVAFLLLCVCGLSRLLSCICLVVFELVFARVSVSECARLYSFVFVSSSFDVVCLLWLFLHLIFVVRVLRCVLLFDCLFDRCCSRLLLSVRCV